LITSIVSIVEKRYGWKGFCPFHPFARFILHAEQNYQPEEQAPNEIVETAAFDFIQFLILDSFHLSFSRLEFAGPGSALSIERGVPFGIH